MVDGQNLSSVRYAYYKGEADQLRLYGPRCINCMTRSFYKNRLDGVDLLYVPTPNGYIPITMRSLVFFNGIQNPFVLKDFAEDILSPDCTRCRRKANKQVTQGTSDATETQVKNEPVDEQIASLPILKLPHKCNEQDTSVAGPSAKKVKLERNYVAGSPILNTNIGSKDATTSHAVDGMAESGTSCLIADSEIITATASYVIDKYSPGKGEGPSVSRIEQHHIEITIDSEDEDEEILQLQNINPGNTDKSSNRTRKVPGWRRETNRVPFICGKELGKSGTKRFYELNKVNNLVRQILSKVDNGFMSFLCEDFPGIKDFKYCLFCEKTFSVKLPERMEHILSFDHLSHVTQKGHVFTKDWNVLKSSVCRYLRSLGNTSVRRKDFNFR